MYTLPQLEYAYDALTPFLSADTLRSHHDRHHRTYVEKTGDLAAEAGLAGLAIEALVREAHQRDHKSLFNNAAQTWNHAFFWRSMRPPGGKGPSGDLMRAINLAFDDLSALADTVVETGLSHFGSGWVWIVTSSDGLQVVSTHDAENTLIREGRFPLLVCDLWEHAYYLDYRSDRKTFLERWVANVANWDFAADQLAAANGLGDGFRYPSPSHEDEIGNDANETQRPGATA